MEELMNSVVPLRKIVQRTRGNKQGPIIRLMSPAGLGELLKPFVFLDLFEADMRRLSASMPVHPHSGIATVTVFPEGDVTFDDPHLGHGTIGYGGAEWARAGGGMWHGKELTAGTSATVQGFQLWIALPPGLENAEPDVQYVGSEGTPALGPARLIVGAYAGSKSPVRAPQGLNYLLITLKPGERWTYEPPPGHTIAWVALSKGALSVGEILLKGDLAVFENSDAPITLESENGATFVLGSAVPHRYPLHLGSHSVHTSAETLAAAERKIRELKQRLDATGDRSTKSGSTPVFRT